MKKQNRKQRKTKATPSSLAVSLLMCSAAPRLTPDAMRKFVINVQHELNREERDLEDLLRVEVFDEIERTLTGGGIDVTALLNSVRAAPRLF
jgi:hypothetical protein